MAFENVGFRLEKKDARGILRAKRFRSGAMPMANKDHFAEINRRNILVGSATLPFLQASFTNSSAKAQPAEAVPSSKPSSYAVEL